MLKSWLSLLLVVNVAVISVVCQKSSLSRVILSGQTDSGSRKFIEESTSREVLFHGVNAIVKGFPWVPSQKFDIDTSLSSKDFIELKGLGVNVIRLGVMWPGVEPTRGNYNFTYLDELESIIKNAADHGIYTLLDMHQDLLSEKFCGEGVPGWVANTLAVPAAKQFPVPQEEEPFSEVAADGFPTREDCAKHGWASYYSTNAASYAFEALYTNVDGLRESWGGFWKVVATRFKDFPSVLGYELINEPWAGDVFAEPKRLIPGVADREVLQPAYDYLASEIRSVDASALIFFAAVTWDDIVPVGFTAAPMGDDFSDRSVFSYHFYTPPQMNAETYFNTRRRDAQRLHVASMLTEFERNTPDNNTVHDKFESYATTADHHLQSWTMWEFKTFCKETNETSASTSQAAAFGACKTGYGEHLIWDDAGNVNLDASRKLSRTYPQQTAGRLKTFSFNATTRDFAMSFTVDTSIAQPTTVHANIELNYDLGVSVQVLPPKALLYEVIRNENRIKFVPNVLLYPELNGKDVVISVKNVAEV